MKERKIRLKPEQVREFVRTSGKCDFDIDVFYNHIVIDAKSILGVLGLDLTRDLTVQYNGYDQTFEAMVDKFAIA